MNAPKQEEQHMKLGMRSLFIQILKDESIGILTIGDKIFNDFSYGVPHLAYIVLSQK